MRWAEPGQRRQTPVEEFLRQRIIAASKLHATLAAVAASDRPEAQAALLKLYPQMVELEQHQQTTANTDSQLLVHIQAMMAAVTPTVASRFDEWDENDPLTKYERGAVELNMEQLAAVRAGKVPANDGWVDERVFDQPTGLH